MSNCEVWVSEKLSLGDGDAGVGLQGLRLVLVIREFNSKRLLNVDARVGKIIGYFCVGFDC